MTATKIPPQVSRELYRHLKVGASNRSRTNTKSVRENDFRSSIVTLAGCTAFVGVAASLPFLCMQWIGPLNERDEALTQAQIRRGAFTNSGSRDVGKDPMWDFKTGTRIKDEDFLQLFEKDDPNEIDHGDRFVADSKRG